ncbi:MAG: hypothetical protein U0X40_04925 [Ferruginibacter sp.]
MFVKILNILGLLACVALIAACFMPWTYYEDLHQQFTGFYSYKNQYGRPGVFIVPLASMILVCMILPRVWAKRVNLFLAAFLLAYCIKTYVLFVSCYNNYCPQKLNGIYLMLGASFLVLLGAIFPGMPLTKVKETT